MQDKLETLWLWFKNERRTVWIEYGGLALIILLPLLLPGYILTLDMVFTPNFAWPSELTNTYPLQALLWLFHLVLPGDVIEKIVLFVILLLSGVGMHTLMRSVNIKEKFSPELWRMALYFGGIFYMVNPFTYSRFMAGQWMFLLGYAMVPFFVKALVKFFSIPSRKSIVPLVAWTFAILSASIHHIGILLLLTVAVPIFASCFGYWRGKKHVRHYLTWSGIGIIALLVLNSYWLLSAVLGEGSLGSAVSHMNDADFKAFATNGSGALGAFGEVIRLQGFWPEARQLYALPQSMIPAWGILFLLIWIIVIAGAIKAWKSYRLLVALAIFCTVTGIVLAATPLIELSSHILPFIAGYREPHKFVSLVVLGYALLGTFGAAFLVRWATDRFNELGGQAATVICMLLPLAITPTMLWGFGGQLSPRQYPAGWYEMNQKIKDLPNSGKILFLPWHQYMTFGFNDRLIANPATKFFGPSVITSDDPEFMNISPTIPDKENLDLSDALKHPETLPQNFLSHDVHYILLAKEEGANDYTYLGKLPGITKSVENGNLILYRVGE